MSLREHVARAIYSAAFQPGTEAEASRQRPSPGWCWDRAGDQMRAFALRQADAALRAIETWKQ